MGEMSVRRLGSSWLRSVLALVVGFAPLSVSLVLAQEGATLPDPKTLAVSAPAPPNSKDTSKKGWRVKGLGLKNGAFEVALAGYAQVDFQHFD